MKNTLNKILYKLTELELSNPNISAINEQAWQKLKNLFKQDKYDYTKATSSNLEPYNQDEVNINYFYIDPPMENSTINSEWGKWRPLSGRRHLGIDMRTSVGTPVYAVRPGIVVRVGDQPDGWGNYVITKHEPVTTAGGSLGETFYALYAHLSDILVSLNSELDFGTIIGKSGGAYGTPGAGNSTGPHLHFEIKTSLNGGSIDPVKFYAKYGQKLENATLKTDTDTNNSKIKPDYIVEPTINTSTSVPISTTITNDIKNDIVSGTTEIDGFRVYKLPGDETYLYGIPTDKLTNLKYDWWTTSSKMNSWVSLKSKLSADKYNKAVSILNTAFPGVFDSTKLTNSDVATSIGTQTTYVGDNKLPLDKTNIIFSKLKKNTIYISPSILKSNRINKYIFADNQFKKDGILQFDNTDSIKYLGHSKSRQYIYARIMSKSDDPSANKKSWINIKDIKLSNKTKF